MAISFVAAGAVATGANPTVTVPTGYAQDDFLIIITAGTVTTTTPTGWTLISAQGAGQFITTFWKFANASESSVALTNAGTTTAAVMVAYRGVGLFDVVSAYTTATATTLATATQTTLLANDYVLSIYANASGAARTWTAPASTTARVNSATTTTVRGLLIVDEAKATAGLTTARTATISASSTLAAVSISIRQPQTLYWRGGTGTWNTTTKTNWSLTSGGTGNVAVPNELDNVVFNTLSNTGTTAFTVTLSNAFCDNFTIDPSNPLDANMTLAGGTSTLFIYGSIDWSGDNGTLLWTGTPTITFGATTTGQTISGGNSTVPGAITFDGSGGAWTLTGNGFLATSTSVVTLTTGTINLNDLTISCGSFLSSGTGVRSITNLGSFSAGRIYVLDKNKTVIDLSTSTNLTLSGAPAFTSTSISGVSQTGTRTISFSSTFTESNAPTIDVTSEGDTITITGKMAYLGISQGYGAGTFTNSAITIFTYGTFINGTSFITFAAGANAWTFAGTSTSGIYTSGNTLDFPIIFDGVGGTFLIQDALTVGATRTVTLTNGTLNLNNFNLTAGILTISGSPTLAFGTGQIYLTSGPSTIFTQSSTATITGTPVINLTSSSVTGTRLMSITSVTQANAISYNVTAGGDIIQHTNIAGINNLNFTGFSGSLANNSRNIWGNLTVSSGMTLTAGATNTTFAATSGTKTITSAGKTFDFPVNFDGVGGTWQLLDAFITGATNGNVTLINGTLDLNNNNLTCRIFSSSNSNTRTITSGTGQFYLTGNGTTIWTTGNSTGLTYTTAPTVNATYTGGTGTRTLTNCNTGGNLSNQAINLNITAGTDIITAGTTSVHKNVNFTGYTGASTFTGYVTGNLTLSATMTMTNANTLYIVDPNVSTQTITSNGCTIDNPVNSGYSTGTVTGASGTGSTATLTYASTTVIAFPVGSTIQVTGMNPSGYNGTYTVTASTITSVSYASTQTGAFVTGGVVRIGTSTTLAGNLTLGATRGFNLIMGTLALGTSNLTAVGFTSNIGVTRSISTSTGQIYCTNTAGGTTVNISDANGYTQTGQVIFNFSGAGSGGTRGFSFGTAGGATETNSPSLVVSNGSDAILINYQGGLKDLTFTSGFTGTFIARTYVYGNLSIASGVTSTVGGDTNPLIMSGTSGTKTVTTNGCVIEQPFYFDGAGGSWQLLDSLSIGTSRQLRVTNGSFDANGFNVSAGTFNSGNTNVRSITMGTGTWTINGSGIVWITSPGTNLTLSGASSTIVLQDNSTTARSFTSGTGLVHGDLVFSGSNTVATTFSGTSTWGTWSSTKTVPFTITLTSGNTYTLGDWTISGSAGNLVTLNASTAGTRATLSKSSGTVSVDYLDIKDSNATGGATWNAGANSVDNGNNLGWIFGAIVTSIINFFAFFNGA